MKLPRQAATAATGHGDQPASRPAGAVATEHWDKRHPRYPGEGVGAVTNDRTDTGDITGDMTNDLADTAAVRCLAHDAHLFLSPGHPRAGSRYPPHHSTPRRSIPLVIPSVPPHPDVIPSRVKESLCGSDHIRARTPVGAHGVRPWSRPHQFHRPPRRVPAPVVHRDAGTRTTGARRAPLPGRWRSGHWLVVLSRRRTRAHAERPYRVEERVWGKAERDSSIRLGMTGGGAVASVQGQNRRETPRLGSE